jgi:hypothetical protein
MFGPEGERSKCSSNVHFSVDVFAFDLAHMQQ